MKNLPRKIIYFIAIALVLFFGARFFIYWKVKDAIVKKIANLKEQGIHVRYNSFDVNSWNGSLSVKDLQIVTSAQDSACLLAGTVQELNVEGIFILPLLLKKKLCISSITLVQPWFQYSRRSKKLPQQSKSETGSSPLRELQIDRIRIDSGKVEMIDSASCGVTFRGRLNFKLSGIALTNLSTDSMKWNAEAMTAEGIVVDLPTSFYKATLQNLSYSRSDRSIQMDSFKLIPTLGRKEFALKSGKQVDQFTLLLPLLKVTGFDLSKTAAKPSFIAEEIDLHFNLDVFRDKRNPRAIRSATRLPVTFMQQLPFPVHIDTLIISPSNIVYQEHPEKGDAAGRISFNELTAGIGNVSNDSTGESRMKVHTRFMNAGEMNADFTFPFQKGKPYSVKGSLVDFFMPEINPMLEPIAHIRIESGKIQAMKFNFIYDSRKSNGNLELRYTDLKILALKDDEYKSTNKLVTLIISAFVKKRIDKTNSIDERTGTIAIERDPQKAVLNYWWKSVLSGIKAVFGFETAVQKEVNKKRAAD